MQTKFASIPDFASYSQSQLSHPLFNHLYSYAQDGLTKSENTSDFQEIKLKLRGMFNMKNFQGTQTSILGNKVNFPIFIAGVPDNYIYHIDAENQLDQVAQELGIVRVTDQINSLTIQTNSSKFALLTIKDLSSKEILSQKIQLIQKCGFKAIVLDFNQNKLQQSENDIRNNFCSQRYGVPHQAQDSIKDLSINVSIQDIKNLSKLPLVIKGIMNREDAIEAVKLGADAIWISNNGGLIMDTAPSTISVLRSISLAAKKMNQKVEIYIDGGFRRGTDILKALAYGANAVFIGRPVVDGLIKGGQQGVKEVFEMLKEELELAMVLTYCKNIQEITEEQVIHRVRPRL